MAAEFPPASVFSPCTQGDCCNDLLCITISRDAIQISPRSGAAHGLLASSFRQQCQTILAHPSDAASASLRCSASRPTDALAYSVLNAPRPQILFSSYTTWHQRIPVCHGDHQSRQSCLHVVKDNDVEHVVHSFLGHLHAKQAAATLSQRLLHNAPTYLFSCRRGLNEPVSSTLLLPRIPDLIRKTVNNACIT